MPITSENQLREQLSFRRDDQFGAFWLIEGDPVLALFVNNDLGVLCFQPTLTWSLNGGFEGGEEDSLGFCLENNQLDELPLEFAIPIDQATDVFVHYYRFRELSKRIKWA